LHHVNDGPLAKAEQKGGAFVEDVVKAQERIRLQLLTAPVDGVVQQLAIHTVGGFQPSCLQSEEGLSQLRAGLRMGVTVAFSSLALRVSQFSARLNLMEYRGIRYTIRPGIERGQWFVVIHPEVVEVSANKNFGAREGISFRPTHGRSSRVLSPIAPK
jgi:hypothetical protein